MDLQGIIADQMGAFTPHDIGGALFSVLLAATLAFLLALMLRASSGVSPRMLAVLAAIVAFAVVLVRGSVPLSIALVGLLLLVRPGVREVQDRWTAKGLLQLAAVAIGLGCGSSAGLIVLLLVIPVALLLRWAFAHEVK
jgi:hypothetical protein